MRGPPRSIRRFAATEWLPSSGGIRKARGQAAPEGWFEELTVPAAATCIQHKTPAVAGVLFMPKAGLEPARACAHCALNAARLPIPPLRRKRRNVVAGAEWVK